LAAVAFFTKQNTIGIILAILIFLLISRLWQRQVKTLLRALLVILLGGLTVVLLLLLFFVFNDAFDSFWDAAFTYNFVYIASTAADRFEGSLNGIRLLSSTGLAQFALVGWAAGLSLLFFKKDIERALIPPLAISLLALPLELILVGMSGKAYKHYYMALLPIFSIFAALAFWFLLTRLSALPSGKKAGRFFTVAVIIILLFAPAADYYQLTKSYNDPSDSQVSDRIQEVASEEDTVLIWGAEAGTNFTSRRPSPSRYVYQYPLYTEGYANQQKIEEFLTEIVENQPKLIIDSRNPLTPLYQFGVTSPAIEESIAHLRAHYHFREGVANWTIYEYVANPDP
jgi:4-amino-4-deoxy-L-arabinose transferase-like glycosyltransferase